MALEDRGEQSEISSADKANIFLKNFIENRLGQLVLIFGLILAARHLYLELLVGNWFVVVLLLLIIAARVAQYYWNQSRKKEKERRSQQPLAIPIAQA